MLIWMMKLTNLKIKKWIDGCLMILLNGIDEGDAVFKTAWLEPCDLLLSIAKKMKEIWDRMCSIWIHGFNCMIGVHICMWAWISLC